MARHCADCRQISIPDGRGGGDGEFIPCDDHAVYVDLDELMEHGWQDLRADAF